MKPRFGIAAWFGRSIGARIVTLSLGLLFAIQIASFSAISASLGQHARSVLPEQLQVGERVLLSLLAQNAQKLSQGATVLAADYGFKQAVMSNDAETIGSALANHGARIGATETALLGTDFGFRATSGRDMRELAPVIAQLAARAAAGSGTGEIALLGGKPHQVVLVPLKAPVTVGWVLMGFPLDNELVADMKSLSALNMTLMTRAGEVSPWSVTLASVPADRAASFAHETWSQQPVGTSGMRSVTVANEEFGVRAKWLTPSVLALVSLSIDEAVRPPRDLQIGLAVITLLGFIVFVFGSLFTAQRVTVPLRALSAAADRLGAGDYTTPMEGVKRADEIGHLAHAFEQMRVSVGEKQAQILKLAYWDSLTGLPNRVQFRDAVRDA
ncbi:MAG: cache domain-containing protein, partial [Burkholderiales bacterium]